MSDVMLLAKWNDEAKRMLGYVLRNMFETGIDGNLKHGSACSFTIPHTVENGAGEVAQVTVHVVACGGCSRRVEKTLEDGCEAEA